MNTIKKQFIQLAIDNAVLKFGEFKLKSGRVSPYFFNAGLFYKASALKQLGQCYASLILNNNIPCEQLFGPAYKGLPLATATAIALTDQGREVTVTFNRKEVKDHGEGGELIGAALTGSTVIIDDVITAGTAFRQARTQIERAGGKVTAVLIALDRCEQGQFETSAISEIRADGIEVHAIISFFDVLDYLKSQDKEQEVKQMLAYHERYGVDIS